MNKNKQQINSFYEDTKTLKRIYLVLTILFYIGFIFGTCAIILYRFISPAELLDYYQPSGEDIIVTIVCLSFAIMFNVIIVKSERFDYYIKITENEIEFSSKGKITNYETSDLTEYKIFGKYVLYKEYVLIFTNQRKIMIITKKEQELKHMLDTLILKNISAE